jgi:hypothetical protein
MKKESPCQMKKGSKSSLGSKLNLSNHKIQSKLSGSRIKSALESTSLKERLLMVASTIPFIAASTMSSSCATSCPYGILNDPYPGQCPRYVDLDGNGICDLSQTTTTTVDDTSTTTTTSDDPSTTDGATSTDTGHGNGANVDDGNLSNQADANSTVPQDSPSLDSGNLDGDATNYHVVPVTMIIIGSYLITYFLFKKGILNRTKHRRIWNLLVTLGYIGSGGTGIILAVLINLGIRTALNPSLTFWHVELSILMVVGTLIHLHIYKKPFKNMFRVLFGFKTGSGKNFDALRGKSK